MPAVLVDADVLIDGLRGKADGATRIDDAAQGEARHLSVLTAAELWAGASADEHVLEALLANFRVLSLDLATAEHGGHLRRRFGPTHGTGLIDAILAATALERSLTLLTNNRRHFPMPGLVLA